MSFEANQGQTDPEVQFLLRGSGYNLYLTSEGMVSAYRGPREDVQTVARMKLEGRGNTQLLHLYEEKYDLPANADGRTMRSGQHAGVRRSVVSRLATGETTLRDLREGKPPSRTAWGCAWAARRELLDEHGFYDACVAGGGDAAMVLAAIDEPACTQMECCMSDNHYRHYLEWAGRFYDAVQGEISWIEGSILHLWHGEQINRRYRRRHVQMKAFEFSMANANPRT